MNRPSRKVQRFLLILCGFVWLIAFTGTHIPAERLPETGCSDKTLHALGYAVLAGSFLLAMWSKGFSRRRRYLRAVIILLIYAALDEITQPLVNRYASVIDWLADGVGVGIAILIDLLIGWVKSAIHSAKR